MVHQGGISEESGGLVQDGGHGGDCGQGALQAAHPGQEECPDLSVEIIWKQSIAMNLKNLVLLLKVTVVSENLEMLVPVGKVDTTSIQKN